jgi:hypothetical protein
VNSTGEGFVFLKNELALLELALVRAFRVGRRVLGALLTLRCVGVAMVLWVREVEV